MTISRKKKQNKFIDLTRDNVPKSKIWPAKPNLNILEKWMKFNQKDV